MAGEESFEQLVQTARKAGAALRDAEPCAAKVGPNPGRLALERALDGRVVQQDDAERAVRDGAETVADRLHLGRRLGVHLPQKRLAEVG